MSFPPKQKKKKPVSTGFNLDAALDQSIGGNGNGHAPAVEQKAQPKTNGFDLDAALDQSLSPTAVKKKDGGSESASNPPLPSQKTDISRGTSVFDNTELNPSLQNNAIATADGGQIPISRATPLGTEGLQELQDRVIKKTASPDDIQALANASGKSPQAIKAHILQGQTAGALIENNDNVQKNQTGILNFINRYNEVYGTKYDPKDILSSSQKLHDFINLANKSTLQSTKGMDITKPLNEGQLKKVGLQFGMTPITDEMANQVVQKTIDEDKIAGIPKDKTIVKIAERINPVDFKATQKALNDKVGWKNIFIGGRDTQGQNDLLNYQKGIAELKYNEALKQNAINKMSQGYINGDQNAMDAGQQELSEVDDNVVDKYPALQKQQIAQQVNDYIAKKSGVVKGYDAESLNDYKEKIFGATGSDRLYAMRDLGLLDNPKTRDIALSMSGNSDYFANNSALGSVVPSFLQPFQELGMSVADITGLRNYKDIITDKVKDELFPKDFSANENDPNALQLKGGVKLTRTIANTTANLAGMLVIATATEGVGTEVGLSTKAASRLAAYTSFGLPTFDPSLKDSKNFIDSEPAQYLYAAINSIANAEGGRLLDLGKITRIPGVSDVFSKAAKGMSENSITEKGVKELLEGGKNKYVDFAVKYGKNVTKGAATMAYFNISNNIIKMGFGDPNTTDKSTIEQAGHAFLDGVLGMSIMGGFGAAADMRNERNTSFKGTIYSMAINHDAAKDVFDIGLKNGEYTKPEYDQKVQILNTATAAKNALDATEQETGTKLTQDQKSVYVANKTAQAVLKNKAEDEGITEETRNKYLSQADKLAEQSTQVLDGLKFTSTLEPLYDLYNAEKEYNAAKEDFNPADKKSDDALLAAKDKYDKLYSDYLKDIPDNISSQSKTETNGESKKENAQKAQSTEENGQQIGILKEKGAEVETAPSIEELKAVKLEGVDQKYKPVVLDDPIFKEPMSAQKAKLELENRHDILKKLVDCLTKPA